MPVSYYTADPSRWRPDRWRDLPVVDFDAMNRAEDYVASENLKAAVNVALALGQPLLLTGEPGTGKTQLAASISQELGLGAPLKYETKSTTEARDLFYGFDTVGRFHAAQSTAGQTQATNFISYQALGLAVIYANDPKDVQAIVPAGFEHPGQRRSVVLIDEVDKAPRDVPNDILNEIEAMYFRIPELGGVPVKADPAWRPVIVITSNSERSLPDAFLRRCIYFHMEFPSEAQLREIVRARIGRRFANADPLLDDALKLFRFMREPHHNLRKRPSTAELLNWLGALAEGVDEPPARLLEHPALTDTIRCTLLKTREDQSQVEALIKAWTA